MGAGSVGGNGLLEVVSAEVTATVTHGIDTLLDCMGVSSDVRPAFQFCRCAVCSPPRVLKDRVVGLRPLMRISETI